MRDEKAASILVHLAADWIAREAGRQTLITPTRVDIGRDRKNATIFVSVFPDSDTPNALAFLERNRDEFRQYLRTASRFSILPFVHFELDEGERNRQHIDEISKDI